MKRKSDNEYTKFRFKGRLICPMEHSQFAKDNTEMMSKIVEPKDEDLMYNESIIIGNVTEKKP